MHCLLVAATANEIAPFLEHYRNSNKTSFIDFKIDVLITGVGLTATTYQLTRYFSLQKPDLVIQAGIGGCFDKSKPLGVVYAITKDCIADESVLEYGQLKTLFDLKINKASKFPYTKSWLENNNKEMIKRTKLKPATAISVNHITSSKKIAHLYNEKFSATLESMEGAAFHYCCLMEKISFLQIRATSNYIGERNKEKWKLKESINNLNNELIRLFENL